MAKDERQTRRAIGGTLLIAALIGAAVLIFFLDDMLDALERRYEVVAIVEEAAGLVDGSPVWVGGKAVGTVTKLGFLPSGTDTTARVAVTLELPHGVRSQVRTDSRAHLTSATPISARAVNLTPGSEAARVLEPGDTLRAEASPTAAELTSRAAGVRSGLGAALEELQELAPAARVRFEQTRVALQGIDLALAEARQMQSDLQANPGLSLLRDPAFAASLDRARAHAAELPVVMAQLRARSAETREAAAAFARLQARADSLSRGLDAAAALLETPGGSALRFQQDSALIRALDDARTELDSLIAEARRNPLRFVF